MSEVQNARKKRKIKYTMRFYVIITVLIVLIAGLILSRTLFFNISNIIFESNTPYSQADIMAATKISVGDNMFGMNLTKRAENLTKNLPYVAEAKFERKLPTTLKITVKAPILWANIQNADGKFYLISDKNKVLEIDMPTTMSGYPTIYGYEPINVGLCGKMDSTSPEKKALVDEIFAALTKNGFENVYSVDVSNVNEIKVQYNANQTISYGTAEDIEFKTELARAIVDQRSNPDETGIINVKSTQYPAFIGTHGGGISKPDNTEQTDGENSENADGEDEDDYYDEDYYDEDDYDYNDDEDDNYNYNDDEDDGYYDEEDDNYYDNDDGYYNDDEEDDGNYYNDEEDENNDNYYDDDE